MTTLRLTLLALIATTLTAQVDTGTLSGLVTDSSGAIIPGAQVKVTQEETNISATLPTNGAGFYSVPALHPGHYDVEVAKPGFQAQRKNGVELHVQDRLELNFTLAIGTRVLPSRHHPGRRPATRIRNLIPRPGHR